MRETPNQSVENILSNPTITEISLALAVLFNGYDVKSKELLSSIEEVNILIHTICTKIPTHLKTQLLLWPDSESEIHYFIDNLKQEYTNGEDSIIDEVLDSYSKYFERWGEWCIIHWRKIVRNYNPEKMSDLVKEQKNKL